MKPSLSIIIPCYNCSRTLEEAVISCYTQGLTQAGFNFEIVMVDDGSTDTTKFVMERLANEHREIRVFFHEKNLGGGATRNTAIENSQSDIIFCLDSDDILAEGTLLKMLNFMLEKKKSGIRCDGVGIHRSIKFKGSNIRNVDIIHTFGYVNEVIPIESLLQRNNVHCPLYSTFMHTKEAFRIAGGYPTDHGFDTQSFAWRFLVNGLTAYTCPNAEYLHRVQFSKSYYIREYESGKTNYNWFLILCEFLYIFNDHTKDLILQFDLNSEKSIYDELRQESNIFSENYEKYICKGTKENKELEMSVTDSDRLNKYDLYWLATTNAQKHYYKESLKYFLLSYKNGLRVPEQFRKTVGVIMDNNNEMADPKETVEEILRPGIFLKRGASSPFLKRLMRKLKKELKNIDLLYKITLHIIIFIRKLIHLIREGKDYREYHNQIKQIIDVDKEIVFDIQFSGIGDWLVYTSLPRLLKQTYGVTFFISEESANRLKNKDILKIFFELNPYFGGIKKTSSPFKFKTFSRNESLLEFIFDKNGKNLIEILEKQFNLDGRGLPEIFYKPNVLDEYSNIILLDENYISGKKFGWKFKKNIFMKEALKNKNSEKEKIAPVDPKKQSLSVFIDMIYSCKHYIGTSSGGASISACFDKPFTVILPKNALNAAIYRFMYRHSRGIYVH